MATLGRRHYCIACWLSLLAGLILLFKVEPVRAEEEAKSCLKGQFVVSASNSKLKRKQLLQDMQQASQDTFEILDQSPFIVLVAEEVKGQISSKHTTPDIGELAPGKDLCKMLSKKRRRDLLAARKSRKVKSVAHVSCSCNLLLFSDAVPNDPNYSSQWGFNQSNDIDINMPEAWDITTGSSGVVVAVIDSGVDYNHPDLVANMWKNAGEVPNNGVDDDGNGYIDDYHGFNAFGGGDPDGGYNPTDNNGHGTHCAGVIGARSNNSSLVAGMNWDVKIMPVKFLGSNGSGYLSDAIRAIDYVTTMRQRGVPVVATNNSWGGGSFIQPLYDAIARSATADILFIAAAGNGRANNDESISYPANYALPNVISVAAVAQNGTIASFSNYGARTVHIGAPGVYIVSTVPSFKAASGIMPMDGTSMAAPHVSGAVALLKAFSQFLTAAELKASVLQNGRPMASLSGYVSTGKMLNVSAMLQAAGNPTPRPTSTPTATATPTSPPSTPTPTLTPTPTPTMTPTPVPVPVSVQGRIKFNGQGLAGAKVLIRAFNGSGQIEERVLYTDGTGNYSFANVWVPGNVYIKVSAAGYSFASFNARVTSALIQDFDATKKPYRLTAKVLSPSKLPLGGMRIKLGSNGEERSTDSQGRVVFDVGMGESYMLSAEADGYQFDQISRTGTILGDTERVFIASPG